MKSTLSTRAILPQPRTISKIIGAFLDGGVLLQKTHFSHIMEQRCIGLLLRVYDQDFLRQPDDLALSPALRPGDSSADPALLHSIGLSSNLGDIRWHI